MLLNVLLRETLTDIFLQYWQNLEYDSGEEKRYQNFVNLSGCYPFLAKISTGYKYQEAICKEFAYVMLCISCVVF